MNTIIDSIIVFVSCFTYRRQFHITYYEYLRSSGGHLRGGGDEVATLRIHLSFYKNTSPKFVGKLRTN